MSAHTNTQNRMEWNGMAWYQMKRERERTTTICLNAANTGCRTIVCGLRMGNITIYWVFTSITWETIDRHMKRGSFTIHKTRLSECECMREWIEEREVKGTLRFWYILFYFIANCTRINEGRDGGRRQQEEEGDMADWRKKRNCWHVFELQFSALLCSCTGEVDLFRYRYVFDVAKASVLSATSTPPSSIDIEMIMLDWKYWYIRKKVKSFTCSIQVQRTHKQHTIIAYTTRTHMCM